MLLWQGWQVRPVAGDAGGRHRPRPGGWQVCALERRVDVRGRPPAWGSSSREGWV